MKRAKKYIQIVWPLLLSAGVVMAAEPFSTGADMISSSMKHVCQVIGVGLIGIGGVGMKMDPDRGVATKVGSMGVGAVFAFLPDKIASFIQSF